MGGEVTLGAFHGREGSHRFACAAPAPRRRGFRLSLCARTVSGLGSEMPPLAMVAPVLVEHDPLVLGLILGTRGVAGSLAALPLGALVSKVR